MLKELTLKNFGLVDCASLELSPGLNVLTGETGAGKSMLLNALRLATGGRSDSKLVQAGAKEATVETFWEMSDSIAELLENIEIENDEDLSITRSLTSEGKSRLRVSGVPVSASFVGDLAPKLLEIHGQSDQHQLKDLNHQRKIVDRFGNPELKKALEDYSSQYKIWRLRKKALKDLEESQGKWLREQAYHSAFVERGDKLSSYPGELEEVESTVARLSHVGELMESFTHILGVLNPEEVESPIASLSYVYDLLSKAEKYDPALVNVSENLSKSLSALEDSIKEIEDYGNALDLDALSELAEQEERLGDLRVFAKAFGGDLDKALASLEESREALALAEKAPQLDELEKLLELAEKEAWARSEKLTELRKETALTLENSVNDELAFLSMSGTSLTISFTRSETLTSTGGDIVEFMIHTKGASLRPLAKSASGGELSRIMLALEVVTSANKTGVTYIFDEIDAGVGGATALEIGKKLSSLSRHAQIIVVTHLAQVAMFADKHFKIVKEEHSDRVSTDVNTLLESERKMELARMLSGVEDSQANLAHVDELLLIVEDHCSDISDKE